MKKTPLRRCGKIGKANIEANKRLKEVFENTNIRSCEIKMEGCLGNWTLAFCHRHPRLWYNGDVEKLSDYKQVIIGCVSCHEKIDRDNDLLEKVFNKLRGKE